MMALQKDKILTQRSPLGEDRADHPIKHQTSDTHLNWRFTSRRSRPTIKIPMRSRSDVFSSSTYRSPWIKPSHAQISISFISEEKMARIIWGSINSDGTIRNGSGDFSVENTEAGKYAISFNPGFSATPGVVATQNNYGDTGQSNLDGVVVPFVNNSYCQINTGNNSNKFQNRSFAFVAIGN
ncbi:hypothetical protein, partial [Burkholderia ubonensis]|uniref:hypothetical protein n=1 Tax=Burkholderia ubonensis TaxID=101571 RepID=UPI001E437D88